MSTKKKKGEREKKIMKKDRDRQEYREKDKDICKEREREIESERKTDRKKRTNGIEDMKKEMSIKCLFCKEKIWERLIENV